MNLFLAKRGAILLAVFLAFACVASADTVYDVSGTFLPSSASNPFHGLLNGGTFNGTFSATLPITSGEDRITTFNINLVNSSGTVLVNLTPSNAEGFLEIIGDCSLSSTEDGSCDVFDFGTASGSANLQLDTPLDFTGGQVIPGFPSNTSGVYGSWAWPEGGTADDVDSLVASGTIDPAVPESGTLVLMGMGLLAGLWIKRKRILAQ